MKTADKNVNWEIAQSLRLAININQDYPLVTGLLCLRFMSQNTVNDTFWEQLKIDLTTNDFDELQLKSRITQLMSDNQRFKSINPDIFDGLIGIFQRILPQYQNNISEVLNTVESGTPSSSETIYYFDQWLLNLTTIIKHKQSSPTTPASVTSLMSQLLAPEFTTKKNLSFYDHAMGFGNSLLALQATLHSDQVVTLYGQEINRDQYDTAVMSLLMHTDNRVKLDLICGDALAADWPMQDDESLQVDAVVCDPPYSNSWQLSQESKTRFTVAGIVPPHSKADFAFILQGLQHLKPTGTMIIRVPHGDLFRGAAEGKIRRHLLKQNLIDTVIGLPAGLNVDTKIPTVLLILKPDRQRQDILFIDAANDYQKQRDCNVLGDQDIKKILAAYQNRKTVKKYAYLASDAEIQENEGNLNIARYVSTYEPAPAVPLAAFDQRLAQIDQALAKLDQVYQQTLKG